MVFEIGWDLMEVWRVYVAHLLIGPQENLTIDI